MRGSLRVGRIAKIPVGFHWSLLAIGVLLASELAAGRLPVDHPGYATGVYWALGVMGAVLFFGAVLAHEISHALVARRLDVGVDGIDLWALGGMARLNKEPPSPRAEFRIAVAGPLTSFAAAGVFLGAVFALHAVNAPTVVTSTFAWLSWINILLAAFNLLPAAPLDGGRILRAIVWKSTGNRWRAMQVSARAGQALGFTIIAGGLWLVVLGYVSFIVPIVGWFLLNSARMEEVGARTEAALIGKQVRDATWFGVARANDATDVATMLWQSSRMGPPRVVAVERFDGSIAGLVSEDQLWRVPEQQRSGVRLAELAVPLEQLAQAGPDEPLMDAARRMNPSAPVVTVWEAGRLIGVVTADRFRQLIQAARLG